MQNIKMVPVIGWTVLVLGIMAMWSTATGQGQAIAACGHRTVMVPIMQQRFQEIRRWTGISDRGSSLIELWTNQRKGTWTITETRSDRDNGTVLCVVAVGIDTAFSPSGLYQ